MKNTITNTLVLVMAIVAITAIALANPSDEQEEKNATLEWVLQQLDGIPLPPDIDKELLIQEMAKSYEGMNLQSQMNALEIKGSMIKRDFMDENATNQTKWIHKQLESAGATLPAGMNQTQLHGHIEGLGAGGDMLEGDEKLACEAILCLSSSTRPSECGPSLSRYFGIHKRKWSDTVRARANFLALCPLEDMDGGLKSAWLKTLARGSGFCSAADLNARGRWIEITRRVPWSECPCPLVKENDNEYLEPIQGDTWSISCYYENKDEGRNRGEWCNLVIRYWEVDETPPDYCEAYWAHEYIFIDRPRLSRGSEPWYTKWVD